MKEFNEFFVKQLHTFVHKLYGDRCEKFEDTCMTCAAWANYDTFVSTLKNSDETYEYRVETLDTNDVETITKLSSAGWNLCAATVSKLNYEQTMFYFKRKF